MLSTKVSSDIPVLHSMTVLRPPEGTAAWSMSTSSLSSVASWLALPLPLDLLLSDSRSSTLAIRECRVWMLVAVAQKKLPEHQ